MKAYIDIHDLRWKKYNVDFQKIVCTAVSSVYKDSEVSIILTNDDEIHQINKQYRGMDKPTNVLSFELGDDLLLGDIYISLDTVMREAKDANIPVENHIAHMVVHGMCHLMGMDHISEEEALMMEGKEIRILKKLGIPNPYDENISCADGSCCPGGKTLAWLKRLRVQENSWVQYALYAVFGGVASFGFAPFYQWWCTIIGVAGAYWLTVRNDKIGGFWKTLLRVAPFGAMYAIAMFWWVLHSIYVVPELTAQYAIWTVPGIVGLGLAGWLIFSWPFVAIARIRTSCASRVFLFAGVWVLVLWAREWMFTGFPWNPIANIAMPFPLIANTMSLWGALGLSFIIVAFVALLVEFLRNYKAKSLWFVLFMLSGVLAYGVKAGYENMKIADVGADNQHAMIRIVQPGVNQSQKATHNRVDAFRNAENNLRHLLGLAMQDGDVDFIVFPETSYPFVVLPDDDMEFVRVLDVPVVMGANTFDEKGMYNSMVVIGRNGRIEKIYSKSHLVPFGEYRPLGLLPGPVNLLPGNGPELIDVNGFVFAPAVCYEVIFSDSLVPNGAENIDAIVNITNDNWFGNTPGTYQHLDMVRRYAIESGLPIVRANYSGISAFVASDGNVISNIPVGMSGVLDGYVWGAHLTPYRAIGMNGWFIIVLGFATLMTLVFARRK